MTDDHAVRRLASPTGGAAGGDAPRCCAPPSSATLQAEAPLRLGTPAGLPQRPSRPAPAVHDDVWVPGGAFLMGDAFDEGYPADGELPVHRVVLEGFQIDAAPVTNA